jgi:hypothetical protein
MQSRCARATVTGAATASGKLRNGAGKVRKLFERFGHHLEAEGYALSGSNRTAICCCDNKDA